MTEESRTGKGNRPDPTTRDRSHNRDRDPAREPAPDVPEPDADRRRRRALFLRELAEARALRERVQPRRVKVARLRQAMRMRTFRW
ncbi:hypothetical protein [Streptomyces sp. NPDC006997]|uniref:hypothetical protein n=1 Tax=Streptomyces sp. NPDC006997 TaxID=3155356 RepID=UPI0033DC28D4